MALFNQLTLRSFLNGRNNLGTLELRAAVASMSEEQKDDALVFLECNNEELAGTPDGQGMQAVANVRKLLDYLPTRRMTLWFSLSVILRSWLAFPMVKVCKLLQMSEHCWTTFLHQARKICLILGSCWMLPCPQIHEQFY